MHSKRHLGADLRSVLAVVLLLTVGTFVAASFMRSSDGADGNGRTSVSATVFPLYDIVRTIAGDAVETTLILPPGASPHTFEPSPSVLVAAQRADVTYVIGHGLDDWIDPLIDGGAEVKVIVDFGIELIEHEGQEEGGDEYHDDGRVRHGEDDGESHGDGRVHEGANPHYWLDARNAMLIAQTVAGDLMQRYPQHGEVFAENLASYLDDLTGLDMEIRAILRAGKTDRIVTLHDAWAYFAEAYGLEIVGSFEPSPGKVPTPQYLADLSDAVALSGVSTLFSEPQLSTAVLEPFLDDMGLSVETLDPLGGVEGRMTYMDMMRYNARTVRDAR